jgi:hypothetical protein
MVCTTGFRTASVLIGVPQLTAGLLTAMYVWSNQQWFFIVKVGGDGCVQLLLYWLRRERLY